MRSDSGREVALKSVQGYEDIELRGITHCMNLKSPHLVTIFDIALDTPLADLSIAYAPEDFDRVYLMSGAIDGARGDHILLAPPFTIEDAQRDELADKLETAVSAVI